MTDATQKTPTYTQQLLTHLQENLSSKTYVKVEKEIKEFSKIYSEKNKGKIGFGKYRGKTYEEVAKFDSKYLTWVIEKSSTSDFNKKQAQEALDNLTLETNLISDSEDE